MAVVIPVAGAAGIVDVVPAADPLPSCPQLLSPHQRTVPSPRTAHACSAPAPRAAGLTPRAVVGGEEFAVLPLPRRPSPLRPQQRALPPCRRAHMWKIPGSMATAVFITLT